MHLLCMFKNNLDEVHADAGLLEFDVTISLPLKTKEALQKCVVPMTVPGIIVTDGIYTHRDAVENICFYLDHPERLKESEAPYVDTTLRIYSDNIPKVRSLATIRDGKYLIDLSLNSSFIPGSAMTDDHSATVTSVSLYSVAKTPMIGGPVVV